MHSHGPQCYGLGSVVGEVDVNGTMLAQKKHDVYGLNRGVVGTAASRHGFVGGLGHYSDDETGFIYMRARYYDPSLGRFISEDSARDGQNWFAYCNNDPLNKIDISGKSVTDIGITLVVAGLIFLGILIADALSVEGKNYAPLFAGMISLIKDACTNKKVGDALSNALWTTIGSYGAMAIALRNKPKGPTGTAVLAFFTYSTLTSMYADTIGQED